MKDPASNPNIFPLTETTYFILLSMAPGPSHGYAIMKDVSVLSEGRVHLSTGTLYGALKRMLEVEWIRRSDDISELDNGRDRKMYTLTDLGQIVLQNEVERLHRLVAAAEMKKGQPKSKDYQTGTDHG